jgi:hypothetical protein
MSGGAPGGKVVAWFRVHLGKAHKVAASQGQVKAIWVINRIKNRKTSL